jgi:ElaB/YqjD/DUF883 family membrane-anchored ribosome-binding protein
MAQSSYGSGPDQFSNLQQKATDQFGRAADQAEDMANRLAEQGRQTAERMQEAAGNIKGAVSKSMNDQPIATLVVAAIVGFVLGALWKS